MKNFFILGVTYTAPFLSSDSNKYGEREREKTQKLKQNRNQNPEFNRKILRIPIHKEFKINLSRYCHD